MEQFDIFRSEGGFRVCGATWVGNNPIMACCPWFPTEQQAQEFSARLADDEEIRLAESWYAIRDRIAEIMEGEDEI